jgi:hypothetical protein
MAGRRSTKSAVNSEATVNKAVASSLAAEDMNEIKEENVVNNEPLKDSDIIGVESLVSNVTYQDSHTNDWYEWEDAGHIEHMDYATIKNMWRNHKGYFRNLYLKPLDNRVIKQLGLESIMQKYELLLDYKNYTRNNVREIVDIIKNIPSGTKYALFVRIRSLVASGDIADIFVIRTLEREFNTDFTSSL